MTEQLSNIEINCFFLKQKENSDGYITKATFTPITVADMPMVGG